MDDKKEKEEKDNFLALMRSTATRHPFTDWDEALSDGEKIAERLGIDKDVYAKLALASSSPQKFSSLLIILKEYMRHNPRAGKPFKLLIQRVDESIYSFDEWIGTIEHFYHWLDKKKREADFVSILGYLTCCAEWAQQSANKHAFVDVLDEMLEKHGYTGGEVH